MNKGIETWLVCRTQSTNDPAVICLRMKYFLPHLKKALQPQNRRKKAFAINPSSKSPLQMKKYFKFHLDLFFFLKKAYRFTFIMLVSSSTLNQIIAVSGCLTMFLFN